MVKSPALKLPTRKATEEEHIWELRSVIIHHTTLPSQSHNLLTAIRVLLKSPLQAAGNASFPKFKLIILTPPSTLLQWLLVPLRRKTETHSLLVAPSGSKRL